MSILNNLVNFAQSNNLVQYIAAAMVGAFVVIQFISTFIQQVHARKEKFLLSAWQLNHVKKEIEAELDERMMQVLFRHKTGISATRRQREIYEDVVSRSNGSIGYADLANNIEDIQIKDGFVTVSMLSARLQAIGFTLVLFVVLLLVYAKPHWTSIILAMAYVLIAYFSWAKVRSLSRLRREIRRIA